MFPLHLSGSSAIYVDYFLAKTKNSVLFILMFLIHFTWFLQPLILIFCNSWVLMGYTELRSILHLSTQILQLVKSFCIIHLLQSMMVTCSAHELEPPQSVQLIGLAELSPNASKIHKSKTFIFKNIVQPKFQDECLLLLLLGSEIFPRRSCLSTPSQLCLPSAISIFSDEYKIYQICS